MGRSRTRRGGDRGSRPVHGPPTWPLFLAPQAEAADRAQPGLRGEGAAVTTPAVTEAGIREKLAVVWENVALAAERSGRDPDEVRVLVESKYYAPEQIGALAAVGVDLVGENRAEDLVEKQERFGDTFEWHFIGHVQRRKAKIVAPRVSLIHSADSVGVITELEKRAPEEGVEILLQVNVSGEESKYGVSEKEVGGVLEAAAATGGQGRGGGGRP